ncbi:unnamed protein product [Vitrella brassicaformis CCMP3155]|uniref:Enoyl-CoA hydratase n=1 Tax=Vitrella brassicaformis (strain CCMP3155) TaxID=1169540 RepID=A0A0G4EC53_VITBC|nr:unnamed protein product [Vitrella brassicaformis CCMP3155]|eukprot:CEL92911.1 unnamed protein product [Vitrella brassicaformis CCMP3155]
MSLIDVERPCEEVFVVRMATTDNRVDFQFIDAMHAVMDQIEASEGAAAVVLTGKSGSKFFSNGLKFEALSSEPGRLLTTFHKLMARLMSFPVPTVAAINGHAFAGGAMLAFCCDWRVMNSAKGWICVNEVDLGLPLTPGMAAVVTAKVDRSLWADMILRAKRFTAADALKLQMIHATAPPDRLESAAVEFAKTVAPKGENRSVYGWLKRQTWVNELRALESGGLGFANAIAQRLDQGGSQGPLSRL